METPEMSYQGVAPSSIELEMVQNELRECEEVVQTGLLAGDEDDECDTAVDIEDISELRVLEGAGASATPPLSPTKAYRVFRKPFHIPSRWDQIEAFRRLVQHEYVQDSTVSALALVHKTLKEMGYVSNNDNDAMIHDYLHYMLMDLLADVGRPFIEEKELPKIVSLHPLFGSHTPDLIVKSGGTLSKPTIIDIYAGRMDREIEKKKAKYREMTMLFDFRVITPNNFTKELKDILPEASILYLFRQFQLFLTKYHYWRACIKFQKLLKNDIQNQAIMPLRTPEDFSDSQTKFLQGLQRKVVAVLDCTDV
jgi:hypothetical protein